MLKPVEYSGFFWLPDNADRQVPGSLRYDPESGTHLRLIGSFGEFPAGEVKNAPVILGTSTNGKDLSLLQCILEGGHHSSPGISTDEFFAHKLIVGHHFTDPENVRFRWLAFEMNNLDEWLWFKPFQYDQNWERGLKLELHYSQPEPILIPLDDEVTIELATTAHLGRKLVEREANLQQDVWARFNATGAQEISLEDFIGLVLPLQVMITIAAGRFAYLTRVLGECDAGRVNVQGGGYFPKQIEILFSQSASTGDAPQLPPLMLFLMDNIRDRIHQIFPTWWGRVRELKPVIDLYSAVRRQESVFMEQRFLTLAQALETYHRRRVGGLEHDSGEYDDLVSKILEVCPEDKRDWLSGKLRTLNHATFLKRLQELLKAHSDEISALQSKPFRKSFAYKTLVTRNYLTHYDESQEAEAITEGPRLLAYSEKMRFLLEMCLLEEMGFSKEERAAMVVKNTQLQAEISHFAEIR